MNEQTHRAVEISLAEQAIGGLRMRLGRRERRHLLPPETRRRRQRCGLTAACERRDHLPCRVVDLAAGEMRHARHRRRREPIPPATEVFAGVRCPRRRSRRSVECGLSPHGGIPVEDRFRDPHEIIHAWIGQALAPGFVQGKLSAQAENVPRIDQRATGHRPHEQRGGGIELIECGGTFLRADALIGACRLPQ